MILTGCVLINVIFMVQSLPLEQENSVIKNKRSAEFIFAGNHQNGERVKKAGPIPPMPLDSPDDNIFVPPYAQKEYGQDESDQNDAQADQLELLEELLLNEQLEKEEKKIDENNIDLSDSINDDLSGLEEAALPLENNSRDAGENKSSNNINENVESMDDEELSEPEITNDEVLQPKDSFLNIPGLRSLYRDYPPVPYPLSYAGIPVKKRSVNMNSNSMPNEFVDSAQDVTNEKKTYRIKRDLHDEDDFEDEQFLPESLYYLPKRFDDFNDRENEYYPSSPYGNLEEELRLQEEAILEEVEERQQRELERKKSKAIGEIFV